MLSRLCFFLLYLRDLGQRSLLLVQGHISLINTNYKTSLQ
jgi:hypothetical protein